MQNAKTRLFLAGEMLSIETDMIRFDQTTEDISARLWTIREKLNDCIKAANELEANLYPEGE